MSRRLVVAIGTVLIVAVCGKYYWATFEAAPPEWRDYDYASATLEGMKVDLPGFGEGPPIWPGWSWFHGGIMTESMLVASPMAVDKDGHVLDYFETVEISTSLRIPFRDPVPISRDVIYWHLRITTTPDGSIVPDDSMTIYR